MSKAIMLGKRSVPSPKSSPSHILG